MLLEARSITRAFGSFKAVDAASVTLEQGDILAIAMIMVAGNCRCIDLAHPGEPVPDRFALAVFKGSALDLRGRRGEAPDEFVGKAIRNVFHKLI